MSTSPVRSGVATVVRTRSARRCVSRSTSTPSTTKRSRSETAIPWSRRACPSPSCAPSSTAVSSSDGASHSAPRGSELSENHYEVLGVDPDASRDQLRDAYRARVDELTAARDRKGITASQLEDNREEVARVRSAWNVLSDPFQRQRYDAQVEPGDGVAGDGDVEIVDDGRAEVQLTGWRRLMAPPPPKPAAGGAGRGAGNPPPSRGGRQPTIPLPHGRQLASSRSRAMALLFDLSIVLVIFYAINILLPPVLQSDYATIRDQVTIVGKAKSAQEDIDDAQGEVSDAEKAVANAESDGTQKD